MTKLHGEAIAALTVAALSHSQREASIVVLQFLVFGLQIMRIGDGKIRRHGNTIPCAHLPFPHVPC